MPGPFESLTNPDSAARIAALNDFHPCSLTDIVLTFSVAALNRADRDTLLQGAVGFGDFSASNDSYGKHDFGILTVERQRYFSRLTILTGNSRGYPQTRATRRSRGGF